MNNDYDCSQKNKDDEEFERLVEKLKLHPMMPRKYNFLQRKKLRQFEKQLLQNGFEKENNEYANLLDMVVKKIRKLNEPLSEDIIIYIKKLSEAVIKQNQKEKQDEEDKKNHNNILVESALLSQEERDRIERESEIDRIKKGESILIAASKRLEEDEEEK